MLIGVDGGALSVSDKRLKVGVYKITKRLLENLSQIDNSNNYRIYSFNKMGEGSQFNQSRFQNRVVGPIWGWSKLALPYELLIHKVDIFLGLSQFVPFTFGQNFKLIDKYSDVSQQSPTLKVGFVYDLGFIKNPQLYPGSYSSLKKNLDLLISRSDRIITISQSTKTDILNVYKIDQNRISVFYPGVDDQYKANRQKQNIIRQYFLFVGALKPGKNIPVLLDAFSKFLRKTRVNVGLVLVGGDYWLDPGIERTINRLSLKDGVIFKGHVEDRHLPDLYRNAISYVSPSLTEGFGFPAVEALACGCPALISNIDTFKEIIGTAGLYCSPNDSTALSRNMETVYSNQTVRRRLIQSGLSKAKQYSWRKFSRNVLEVINNIKREYGKS